MSSTRELPLYSIETITTKQQDIHDLKIVPARYPLRTIGSVISVSLILLLLYSVFTNERWGWNIFAQWFFSEPVLVGLGRTLLLTVIAAILGSVLGTLLALARLSKSPVLSSLSWAYIWFIRSVPLIVLLLIFNNLGYLYEQIRFTNPLTGNFIIDYPMVSLITPFAAAIIGLTLNQSAFFAEIVRGGILSVDQGQHEAAAALGLPKKRQVLRIVLPQAMRSILPTGFNEFIGLAKGTSMVYVLALPELFYTVQVIYRRNLEVIPLLMVATVWYLVIMTVLSIAQYYIEQYYGRGADRNNKTSQISQFFHKLANSFLGQNKLNTLIALNATDQNSDKTDAIHLVDGASIHINTISKSYGTNKVLDQINLHIPAGSVTAIIGPSGSGKSTLLRSINHLEYIDKGFIDVDGELIGYRRGGNTLYELKEKDILKQRSDIAMVFQNFNLFPHMTVLENIIEAPIQVKNVPYDVAVISALNLLDRIGLRGKAHSYPRQLSGGQQQRVAIMRAIALKPRVLLFDEPTSALDPELVGEVLDLIRDLAKSGTTMIVVTHEIGFAREVADMVVYMEGGHILEKGSPEMVINQPRNPRTREFLSKVL